MRACQCQIVRWKFLRVLNIFSIKFFLTLLKFCHRHFNNFLFLPRTKLKSPYFVFFLQAAQFGINFYPEKIFSKKKYQCILFHDIKPWAKNITMRTWFARNSQSGLAFINRKFGFINKKYFCTLQTSQFQSIL